MNVALSHSPVNYFAPGTPLYLRYMVHPRRVSALDQLPEKLIVRAWKFTGCRMARLKKVTS